MESKSPLMKSGRKLCEERGRKKRHQRDGWVKKEIITICAAIKHLIDVKWRWACDPSHGKLHRQDLTKTIQWLPVTALSARGHDKSGTDGVFDTVRTRKNRCTPWRCWVPRF